MNISKLLNNHDLAYTGVQHYFNVIKLRMTDDFKSETCDRIGVRVLDRLLRDNPFTYLPSQTAQMGERREECWGEPHLTRESIGPNWF